MLFFYYINCYKADAHKHAHAHRIPGLGEGKQREGVLFGKQF